MVFWFGPNNVTDTYSDGRFNPDAWADYGLVAAFLIFVGILVTSLGTHKHIPRLLAPPESKAAPLGKVLKRTKRNLTL